MNLYDAIQILRLHNQYFRCPAHIPDDARPPLVDAWALAEAIDVVLSELHAASYASTHAQLQVDQLQADLMESDEIREKLGHLLTRTAAALKGEPPAGVWHSWHDLPEKAAQLAEALKKVAQSLEWYAHGRCRGFDDEAPLPTNEAIELAERTLAKVRA